MFQHSINYFNGLNNIIFRSKSRIFRYFGEIVLSMCVTTSHMSPMWLIQVPSRSKIFLLYLKVSVEQMSIPRTTSWLQCLFASIDIYRFVRLFCETGRYLQLNTTNPRKLHSGTRAGKYYLL